MALIRCRECNNAVSPKAKTCPSCGAPVKGTQRSGCLTVVAGFVFFSIAAGVVVDQIKEHDRQIQQAEEASRNAAMSAAQRAAYEKQQAAAAALAQKKNQKEFARKACQAFVSRSLHDPASAQFEDYQTYYAEELPTGGYLVQVKVRAKNAFNATRQAIFDCETKLVEKDWIALRVEQINP